jgi:putative membrane protein
MMWRYGDHMSGWMWAVMGTGTVLIWAVLITGIVVLVRHLGAGTRESTEPTPLVILERRLASGEITEEQFRSTAKVLER